MGYARNIGSTSSEVAELWALGDGLTLCHQLQLMAVKVELDAKLIVNAITNNSCCHNALSPLIDDCRKLLSQLPQVKVLHCYLEANFCADALAKKGTSLEQDFILYPLPLTHVIPLLDKDTLGLFCNRLCNSLPNV
jgi:ribonuclease HI